MTISWQSCVPSLYFQKWVAIENPRLWCVQTVSYALIMVGVVWVLAVVPAYTIDKSPQVRFNSWIYALDHIAGSYDPSICSASNITQYAYKPSAESAWEFNPSECAEVVNVCPTGRVCIPAASVTQSGAGVNFIATSFIQENYDAATAQTTTGSYLIPGAEKIVLKQSAEFQVEIPSSWVHTLLGIAMMATDKLKAVLVDHRGNQVESWLFKDEWRAFTLERFVQLAGASLDEEIPGMLQEFPDNQLGAGYSVRPRPRVTGLDLVLNAEITNSLSDSEDAGPVAKLSVRAKPAWMSHMNLVFEDHLGSTKTRHYHGIRFVTTQNGALSWFQLNKVIYTWSLYSVWLQIPVYLVFYFAIMGLGVLSKVFTGFVYEEVDLKREFNGVSSRMLEMTYGFHDLHDKEEAEFACWGATQKRIQNRIDRILEHDKNLDVAERTQFTEFLFTCSSSSMPSGHRAMQLDDYRRPHMTNENLLFEDVLQIVDSDRQVGNVLERIFMDDSLKEFSAAAEKAEAEILGKKRPGKRTPNSKLQSEIPKLIENGKLQKTVKAMGRINTIARANYGQAIIAEQMGNLEKAFDKMSKTCENVNTAPED